MTPREKLLYHHAHPAKLAADVVAAIAAAWLLWEQHLLRAAAIGVGVPAVASMLVLAFADLRRVTQTAVGVYVGRHMSIARHTLAVIGVLIVWGAAWYRSILSCAAGAVIVAFAWLYGPLLASASRTRSRR